MARETPERPPASSTATQRAQHAPEAPPAPPSEVAAPDLALPLLRASRHDTLATEERPARRALPRLTAAPLQHVGPGAAALHPSSSTAPATERDEPPAPIVHVTIDRIDVRLPPGGTPPPQRSARGARTEHATPLADYLRGRAANGGAR